MHSDHRTSATLSAAQITTGMRRWAQIVTLVVLQYLCLPLSATAAQLQESVKFDIAAQSLDTALLQFSKQAGIQVLTQTQMVAGKTTAGINGEYVAEQALVALLRGSGLQYKQISTSAVTVSVANPKRISSSQAALQLAQTDGATTSAAAPEQQTVAQASDDGNKTIEEITVTGEAFRSINVDQARTADGPRPYIILDRQTIERSGATSFADVARLMSFDSESRPETTTTGNENRQKASINFRGVGQNSTLILINGRRTAPGYGGQYGQIQFDLNSLPLSAIERIEILPYSASAVYGGSAIGGVVNVVLRNDYRGAEVGVKYGSDSGGDVGHTGVNFAAGYSSKDSRSNVSFAGGWQRDEALQDRDRGYQRELRSAILERNPNSVLNSTSPPGNIPGNIRSATPLFGAGTTQIAGIPAGMNGPATAADFLPTAGRYNVEDYTQLGNATYLRPEKELLSFQIMANHKLFGRTNLFAELNFNQNEAFSAADSLASVTVPANNPFNPFGRAVTVANYFDDIGGYRLSSKTETQRWVVGINGELPGRWQYMTDVIYEDRRDSALYAGRNTGLLQNVLSSTGVSPINETDPTRAYNPFIDFSTGYRNRQDVIDRLRNDEYRNKNYDLLSWALRLNGEVHDFSWGKVTMSGGLEYRDETTNAITNVTRNAATGQPVISSAQPNADRQVSSAFTEFTVPLHLGGRDRSATPLFEVALAGRFEDYSDFGSAFNKQVAVKFAPWEAVQFRVSYATGYTPPDLSSLVFAVSERQVSVTDTKRNNEVVTITQTGGGNVNLLAEESDSYSAGIIFMPKAVPGLRLSADWFSIEKDNQIIDTPSLVVLLDNAPYLPAGRIVRAAPTPGDIAAGLPGVLLAADLRAMNFAKLRTQGVDLTADYSLPLFQGELSLRGQGTYVDYFERQTAPTAPTQNFVGNPLGSTSAPLRFRGNLSTTFSRNQYAVTLSGRYLPHYLAAANSQLVQGGDYVGSSVEIDLNASWQFGSAAGGGLMNALLADTRVTFGINNLFDRRPPYVGSGQGYSTFNDTRERFGYLSLRRQF